MNNIYENNVLFIEILPRCDVCGHVAKENSTLRKHVRKSHPEVSEYTFSRLSLPSGAHQPKPNSFKVPGCGLVVWGVV